MKNVLHEKSGAHMVYTKMFLIIFKKYYFRKIILTYMVEFGKK